MKSKQSLSIITLMTIFILVISAVIPFSAHADGMGGNPPPPKDTSGINSMTIPDSSGEITNPDDESYLLDIINILLITL